MAKKSRILGEMHETFQGMHRSGMISDEEMLEYDALCFQPEDIPEMSRRDKSNPPGLQENCCTSLRQKGCKHCCNLLIGDVVI